MWMRLGSTGAWDESFLSASSLLVDAADRGTAEVIISSGGLGWVKVNGSSTVTSLQHSSPTDYTSVRLSVSLPTPTTDSTRARNESVYLAAIKSSQVALAFNEENDKRTIVQ